MPTEERSVEIQLHPFPPDTVSSIREELPTIIRDALRGAGRESLLDGKEIVLDQAKTFPSTEVLTFVLGLMSGVAVETYKEVVLPILKKRFGVKEKSK